MIRKEMLYKALGIDINTKALITFVGAGGKTSAIFSLGEELIKLGKKVLITTTTAIYYPQASPILKRVVGLGEVEKISQEMPLKTMVVAGNKITSEGKLKGFKGEEIDKIFQSNSFEFILVEGDGAHCKSIKAPEAYEPVIPECTSFLVAVVGMDVIRKSVNEQNIHRIDRFIEITGARRGGIINSSMLIKLISHPRGSFKNCAKGCRRVLILNKADSNKDKMRAFYIKVLLKVLQPRVKSVIASLKGAYVYGRDYSSS